MKDLTLPEFSSLGIRVHAVSISTAFSYSLDGAPQSERTFWMVTGSSASPYEFTLNLLATKHSGAMPVERKDLKPWTFSEIGPGISFRCKLWHRIEQLSSSSCCKLVHAR